MPTPVSALLHAATMVCSGVFVLVRSSFILEYTPSVLLTILWLAGLTTLVSGLIAVVTNDIKRVIALSTMSQRSARENIIIILNNIFRHQTICVEVIFYYITNSQITKAHDVILSIWHHINNNFKYLALIVKDNLNSPSFSISLTYFYNITLWPNVVKLPILWSGFMYYISLLYWSTNRLWKRNEISIWSILKKLVKSEHGQYFLLCDLSIMLIFMSEKWKIIIISKLVGISEAIRLVFIQVFKVCTHRFPFRDYFIHKYIYRIYLYLLYYLKLTLSSRPSLERRESFIINSSKWYNELSFIFTLYVNNIKDLHSRALGGYPLEEEVIMESTLSSLYSLDISKKIKNENIDGKVDNNSSSTNGTVKEIYKDNISIDPFNEWLAGVIDGDGHFHLAKSGTARLNIVMDIRDKNLLYKIKHKFGGSIYTVSNANAVKYQLSHKKGLIKLINAINGNIRNPKRMLQVNKLCLKYDIKLIFPKPLTFNNGWYAGIIDSDGSIYMNVKSGQIFISVTQKDKYILEPLIDIYNGRIRIISPKIEAFRHDIYRKNELFYLIDNYFNKYPLLSEKSKRLLLIKQFYLLRPYRNSEDINKLNEWLNFIKKWNKYGNE